MHDSQIIFPSTELASYTLQSGISFYKQSLLLFRKYELLHSKQIGLPGTDVSLLCNKQLLFLSTHWLLLFENSVDWHATHALDEYI